MTGFSPSALLTRWARKLLDAKHLLQSPVFHSRCNRIGQVAGMVAQALRIGRLSDARIAPTAARIILLRQV
jgi:hypothetical protein